MIDRKWIGPLAVALTALAVLIAVVMMNGEALGLEPADNTPAYETRLFDTSAVHTIDLVMDEDDWESFLANATAEEYTPCTVVIDGEKFANVGLRAKGNTSLSSVAAYGNNRYSFKLEFDQYNSGSSYYGLDKLSLNNLIQDNTYMKDYLCYRLMADAGVAAPLCSYAYITVNGADWGLYLAVEGVEQSFLQRNYGANYGELYKPDSMDMGGGRGNGRDFTMDDAVPQTETETETETGAETETGTETKAESEAETETDATATAPGDRQTMAPGGQPSEDFDPSAMGGQPPEDFDPSAMGGQSPEDFDPSALGDQPPEDFDPSAMGDKKGGMGGMNMGSADVLLQYIDDDPASYANIFDNAKTDASETDQARLIAALQRLSDGDAETAVDTEAVIRYFVVHTFVNNNDSYTGSLIHNYYLYEEDGLLSMLPWDYNLAFSGMGGMGGMGGSGEGEGAGEGCTADINAPIDTPVSSAQSDDRPMLDWIFDSEETTALYHQIYEEFMETCFDSGYFETLMAETVALIAPYVQKDPTAFCTYEEFTTATETLTQYCLLRAESVKGQLSGEIPATEAGQSADSSTLIDASFLNAADMGSFSANEAGPRP